MTLFEQRGGQALQLGFRTASLRAHHYSPSVNLSGITRRSSSRPGALPRLSSTKSGITNSGPYSRQSSSFSSSAFSTTSHTFTMAASESSQQPPTAEAKEGKDVAAEEKLPPLSDHDFKIYNHMAEHMDLFHNHFRQTWNLLWNACTQNRRPRNMTLKQFLDEGIRFVDQLTMHHNIEERHIFPMLGKRMPEFRGDLQAQHREIHAGLDVFGEYVRGCKTGEHSFELGVLKERMESWGGVLWEHLDEEVKTLGAENMRKYWSKEEMMRMPM